MSDMLVKLFSLPSPEPAVSALLEKGIRIKKALAPDRSKVVGEMCLCQQPGQLLYCDPGQKNHRICLL